MSQGTEPRRWIVSFRSRKGGNVSDGLRQPAFAVSDCEATTNERSIVKLKSVCAGVAYLDEHVPGWESMIDLDELELEDSERCVLGQIWFAKHPYSRAGEDAYYKMLGELGLHKYGDAPKLGFSTRNYRGRWSRLTAAWREVLRERLAA